MNMLLTVSNCAMESCNTTYYVLVLFVLLIAVLLLVNFMTKRALAKGNSEDGEGAKPSSVTKFMNGVDFFLALSFLTVAVNHFHVSVLYAGSHGYRLRFRRIYIVSVPYVAPEATHIQRYRQVSNTRVDLRLV